MHGVELSGVDILVRRSDVVRRYLWSTNPLSAVLSYPEILNTVCT